MQPSRGSMTCLAVRPGSVASFGLVERPVPVPADGEVLVRILEVGICGTDLEINEGLYGEPPPGEEFLVLGHESLGELANGDLVVPMVRRPCPDCASCREGSADQCTTGRFTELGIKGRHGMLRGYTADDPRYLIPVPKAARGFGVLLEPMSVVAKGLRRSFQFAPALARRPGRALVLGAGPIGLLATLALRRMGWDVVTMARKPAGTEKARLACAAGARYASAGDTPVARAGEAFGSFDLVFEATGSAAAAFDATLALALNGVLCLTSVTAGAATATLPVDRINRELVLGNRIAFGTVNAHRSDFEQGLAHLLQIEERFPGLLGGLFTARVPASRAGDIFEIHKTGIKTVVTVA